MDATKWLAGSAAHSSAGCVRSALILRVHTYISAILLPSVTIFCSMECLFLMMMMRMMVGGKRMVYFLRVMMMMMTK
jgi:hypothetical protein